MRVMIVDDEPLARQRLRRLLVAHPGVEVVAEAGNGREALEAYRVLHPELLLLDIEMPGMNGMELATRLARETPAPAVVFCTAYDEHAIAAFDAGAVAYLLKPVSAEGLGRALAGASRLNQAQLNALARSQAPRQRQLCARSSKGMALLPIDAVRYFHADNKYVAAVHPDGEMLLDESLKELEEAFGALFVRVHRNALVARDRLRGLQRLSDGRYRVVLDDIDVGPLVSRRHLGELKALLADS